MMRIGFRNFAIFAMALFMGIVANVGARAAEVGTIDEARALLDRAVAAIKAEGKDSAFAKFNDQKGTFIDRDLYVFVFKLDGTTLAHGGNPALVGRDVSGLKDVDGKPFMMDMINLAKGAGEGWIDYKWLNATNKKIEAKRSYIIKLDDFLVGVGVYLK
jgi:cytochrome c